MEGSYEFRTDDGELFEVPIDVFSLRVAGVVCTRTDGDIRGR